jgi:polyphosphate glucokinase
VNVLAIDVGGSHVKLLVSNASEPRRFVSGPKMTPELMVAGIHSLLGDWKFDVATIGYPGPVQNNHIIAEPHNLAPGWLGYDFEKALGCPVKLINDAAMQALGDYKGGKMLFLGLGTGLGTTMIADGVILPMELGHLPYKKATFEDYVGELGLEKRGKKKWRAHVEDVVARLTAALMPDDIVLGGGNARLLDPLPARCRVGANTNAFPGGFRMWEPAPQPPASKAPAPKAPASKALAPKA